MGGTNFSVCVDFGGNCIGIYHSHTDTPNIYDHDMQIHGWPVLGVVVMILGLVATVLQASSRRVHSSSH